MKNLKPESIINLVLILVSLIFSIYTGNGLYLFFGVLYSIMALLHKYYLKARSAYDRYNLRCVAVRHSQGGHFV